MNIVRRESNRYLESLINLFAIQFNKEKHVPTM